MTTYRTLQGDTWDGIAFKLYGDASLMALLIKENPLYAGTALFAGNILLSIPDKPVDTSDTLPPWRRGE